MTDTTLICHRDATSPAPQGSSRPGLWTVLPLGALIAGVGQLLGAAPVLSLLALLWFLSRRRAAWLRGLAMPVEAQ